MYCNFLILDFVLFEKQNKNGKKIPIFWISKSKSKSKSKCCHPNTTVKKTNPGIAFTEVGRVLGDKWKKMTGKLDHCTSSGTRYDLPIIACITSQHLNTFPCVLNVCAVEEKEPYEARAQQDKKTLQG